MLNEQEENQVEGIMGKRIRGKPKKKLDGLQPDIYAIWITIIFVAMFGLLMIYSTSGLRYINSVVYNNDSMYLLKRQAIFVTAGFVVCFIFQYIDCNILYKFSKPFFFTGLVSILLLKTPLGVTSKGATRWLNVMGIQFQVAELIKICVLIMLAYMIQRYSNHLSRFALLLRMWICGGGTAILLMIISNDLSSSLVVLGITFGITFVYTKFEWLHIIIAAGGLLAAGVYALNIWNNMPTTVMLENMPFRVGRIAAWLDPERYEMAQGYQTLQSLYAIGSGGLWGKGLGDSTQKINSIPEAQNDMIFSVICEELGMFGAIMLILLLAYLIWQLVKVAVSSNSLFGAVLVTGIMIHISLQSIINIGVNLNLLPNTGIGLPFISYGGTAVFCQLIEMAIVLSVGRKALGNTMFKVPFENKMRKKIKKSE